MTAQPPSYGTVTFTGRATSRGRRARRTCSALEDQPPGTSRIASTWYTGGTETFSVVTTDDNEHTVALYLLDWDGGRGGNRDGRDSDRNGLASAEAFRVHGRAVRRLHDLRQRQLRRDTHGGSNAVVSGVFFGGPRGPRLPRARSSIPAAGL